MKRHETCWKDAEARALRRRIHAAIDRRMRDERPASKTQLRDAAMRAVRPTSLDWLLAEIGATRRSASIDDWQTICNLAAWLRARREFKPTVKDARAWLAREAALRTALARRDRSR